MASLGSSTVTIERAYFDILVRRAQAYTEQLNNNGQPPAGTLCIPQSKYDQLTLNAKKYENLCRNLFRGGLDHSTVNFLSLEDAAMLAGPQLAPPPPETSFTSATSDGGAPLRTSPPTPAPNLPDQTRSTFAGNRYTTASGGIGTGDYSSPRAIPRHRGQPAWMTDDVEEDDNTSCGGSIPDDEPVSPKAVAKGKSQRPATERECMRTLHLSNLAEGTTHSDIIDVVRGGILLDVFIRSSERSASVSFAYAEDAQGFFNYVRKHDLYIRNKRIEVKWSDFQFVLPGQVAAKIRQGATRNLVIRRCDAKHTEQSIREDLDHIHNLSVVKVEFIGGDCFISLNSIHNAIYAQMCMMSRAKYKSSKIEWGPDECSQSYERLPPRQRKEPPPPPRKVSSATNRFQLLNIEDDDEEDSALPRAIAV
ncbi:hypothetical protein QBC46DRAFT_172450 [Diplogelasinospora grovesii]|uniref:Negative regulator of differentiation 1 n=1 Tax=Diplogelasinospora grovesii TaxID=303347 RepID=A0AAN6NHM4_9PEZI|nr:hypothetical protein QBC46DRAFT_172450 [Diplogelasinospora grovesii]